MQVPRDGLVQKLQRLSQSQQSIESVSSFCIFYHKDAAGVVAIWDSEFHKATQERRLALLFLANHILQEGRKKGSSFQEEFYRVLPKALALVARGADDKTRRQVQRLVNVWEERRVFGSRHVKSFKDVVAPGGGGGGGTAPAATAAAAGSGGGGAAAAAAAAGLGPVGDALLKVKQCASTTASKKTEFSSSWSQATLDTAGLAEVGAANTNLASYTAALHEELGARKAALAALAAETARQTAEVSRLEGQVQSAGGQQQELEQQLTRLTQQMASAVASLGQLMQQQNGGGATPQAAAATPPAPAAAASPEAPELELEDSEADSEEPAAPALNPQPMQAAAAAAAAVPGADSGQLAELLAQLQPPPQSQPLQLQPQGMDQQQQQQPTGLQGSLQALLGNPAMLSAVILSGSGGVPAAGDGMQMLLNPDAAAAGGGGSMFSAATAAGAEAAGQLGLGGLGVLEQMGFADEGDDPYDPLEG